MTGSYIEQFYEALKQQKLHLIPHIPHSDVFYIKFALAERGIETTPEHIEAVLDEMGLLLPSELDFRQNKPEKF